MKKISTAEDYQKKAAKALLDDWANMPVAANFADADEVMDPTEAQDYVISANQNIIAEENDTNPEDFYDGKLVKPEDVPKLTAPKKNNYKNLFDPEPVHLGKNDAKDYTRSAAPTFRGRMNLNILRVSGKQVFA